MLRSEAPHFNTSVLLTNNILLNMSVLKISLEKIINLLRVNYPATASPLQSGLTVQEIATLTQDMSFKLPLEVYELFQCCNGEHVPIAPSLVLFSLDNALEESMRSSWMKGDKIINSDYALPIFHGDGKDFYFVLCNQEQKSTSPVWCVFAGEGPQVYAASLTSLILTLAECYETGAYYIYFDEECDDFVFGEDLEKVEQIFQKYNPKQMDTWRSIWKD